MKHMHKISTVTDFEHKCSQRLEAGKEKMGEMRDLWLRRVSIIAVKDLFLKPC